MSICALYIIMVPINALIMPMNTGIFSSCVYRYVKAKQNPKKLFMKNCNIEPGKVIAPAISPLIKMPPTALAGELFLKK